MWTFVEDHLKGVLHLPQTFFTSPLQMASHPCTPLILKMLWQVTQLNPTQQEPHFPQLPGAGTSLAFMQRGQGSSHLSSESDIFRRFYWHARLDLFWPLNTTFCHGVLQGLELKVMNWVNNKIQIKVKCSLKCNNQIQYM